MPYVNMVDLRRSTKTERHRISIWCPDDRTAIAVRDYALRHKQYAYVGIRLRAAFKQASTDILHRFKVEDLPERWANHIEALDGRCDLRGAVHARNRSAQRKIHGKKFKLAGITRDLKRFHITVNGIPHVVYPDEIFWIPKSEPVPVTSIYK